MSKRRDRGKLTGFSVKETSKDVKISDSESGMGFTSVKERDAWKHRQARISVGLPPEEASINTERERLQVTLAYNAATLTKQQLQESRRRSNFEAMQDQFAQSSGQFIPADTRLKVREDQEHMSRMVQGPSRILIKEVMRLDNKHHLLDTWQPKLDAKYDASERMSRPVCGARLPFWQTKEDFTLNPKHRTRSELLLSRRTQSILDGTARWPEVLQPGPVSWDAVRHVHVPPSPHTQADRLHTALGDSYFFGNIASLAASKRVGPDSPSANTPAQIQTTRAHSKTPWDTKLSLTHTHIDMHTRL